MASNDQTDRTGVHAVAAIFTKLGWAFREQLTSDYGIDAQAEKLDSDGAAAGKLIGLQIKSGASYFKNKGEDFVFYGEPRHKDYWLNHSLPVFLILHNPETGLTLWQRVERHLVKEGKDGRWAIIIPSHQTLDAKNEHFIAAGVASDEESIRRARLTLDLPLIRQVSEHSEIYVHIDDWVNKSLNLRGASFVLSDDPDAEADFEVDVWMPGTLEQYMDWYFPWLDWELHTRIGEEEGAFEVAVHIVRAELSEIGKAALLLEEFYSSGPPERPMAAENDGYEDEDDVEDIEDLSGLTDSEK